MTRRSAEARQQARPGSKGRSQARVAKPEGRSQDPRGLRKPALQLSCRACAGLLLQGSFLREKRGAMKLRPYQLEALEAIDAAQRRGLRRVLLALPTGAGKTVIFSSLVAQHSGRALVLAHRRELIAQAKTRLEQQLGGEGRVVSVEMGDLRAADDARVIVASIRSLRPERLARLTASGGFDLVVYDECHHATANENAEVLRRLGVFEPDFSGLLVGVTATTRRADGEGLDKIFQEIVYAQTLADMIEQGYLRPLRGYTISTGIAWDPQLLTREDDGQGEQRLADAIDVEDRNALVARSIQELARDRRTIAFCVTVAHAERLARALNYFGVRAGMVCGAMPKAAREATLSAFAQGKLSVLTNVGVLTEGFDDPGVSAIAMVRPTRSESLYIQCVGRGMRLSEAAPDCLVLDFVDACRLDLVTLPSLAGLPRALNLQGERLDQVVAQLGEQVDWLAEVVEDEDISLSELKARAKAFDPLTQSLNPEVQAVSGADWFSLGPKGVGLYVKGEYPKGRPKDAPIGTPLRQALRNQEIWAIDVMARGARGEYRVYWDGVYQASFSRLVDAVQAVDYELERKSGALWASAQPGATWRHAEVPRSLQRAVQKRGQGKLRPALALHECLRQLRWLDRLRRVETLDPL